MLNRLASLVMSTSILKALSGKLDIKNPHSPSILYLQNHNRSLTNRKERTPATARLGASIYFTCQIVALGSAVVETHILVSLLRGFITKLMCRH